MKNIKVFFIFVTLIMGSLLFAEKDQFKYFRMDKILQVSGKIMQIRMEERYEKDRFVVIELRDRKTDITYDIEVSPFWFYKVDVVEGSIISVKGSLNHFGERKIILAQSVIFEGEIFNFRDKFGFPLWRGERHGAGKNKWKGEMRKKGKG